LRWRLRYWCPYRGGGDTIDIDGVRIRIIQIDTPETFGPRCENELILGRKAKKRLRELLDCGTVENIMEDSVIAMSMALLGSSGGLAGIIGRDCPRGPGQPRP
jgi:hypothetical protein